MKNNKSQNLRRKTQYIAKYITIVIVFFSFAGTVNAQSDTVQAAKNIHKSVFLWQENGNIERDTTKIANNKAVGDAIPHLTLYNLSKQAVPVKLSFDAKTWTSFDLKPVSKNLYRCNKVSMYVIINPNSDLAVKAKLTMYKKYKIFYYSELEMFEITEIP